VTPSPRRFDRRPLVTVLCPVFNESACVPLFYERWRQLAESVADRADLELVFCNNCSTDDTAQRVLALRERDPRVQLLTYTRNVGYQASLQGGLRQAGGDASAMVDVDCEDPPEMIAQFIDHWVAGYDLVYGERHKRREPAWITACRKIFYRLNRLVADNEIIVDMAEFCLIDASVRDAILVGRNTFPFLRAEIAALGLVRKAIPYDRQPRIAGETHYNLWGMTGFAIAGILSATTLPLRMALYLLVPLLALNSVWFTASIGAPEELAARSFKQVVVVDLSYLAVFIALLALYLARTYRNVIGRPLAVVDALRSATNSSRSAQPETPHG
jgi:dolichol-phosphate mannosyltransferase